MILTCALITIIDGDTLRCDVQRIRIANIDAPEVRTCPAQADAATRALQGLTDGRTITVLPLYADRYGRTVAEVLADGISLGQAMIATGTAQPWPHTPSGRALTDRPRGC